MESLGELLEIAGGMAERAQRRHNKKEFAKWDAEYHRILVMIEERLAKKSKEGSR